MSRGMTPCTQEPPVYSAGTSSAPTLRQRILTSRSDPHKSRYAVAVEVLEDPLFETKFRSALLVEMRSQYKDLHRKDEITQEALRSIFQYLCKKGITEYTDQGEEPFHGWLFVLCRRHIRWAVLQLNRQRLMPTNPVDQWEDSCSTSHIVHEHHYEQALRLVAQTIRTLQQPLQGVLWDDWNKLPVNVSAKKRGISKNYVAILRSKGRLLLQRILRDQLLPMLK